GRAQILHVGIGAKTEGSHQLLGAGLVQADRLRSGDLPVMRAVDHDRSHHVLDQVDLGTHVGSGKASLAVDGDGLLTHGDNLTVHLESSALGVDDSDARLHADAGSAVASRVGSMAWVRSGSGATRMPLFSSLRRTSARRCCRTDATSPYVRWKGALSSGLESLAFSQPSNSAISESIRYS